MSSFLSGAAVGNNLSSSAADAADAVAGGLQPLGSAEYGGFRPVNEILGDMARQRFGASSVDDDYGDGGGLAFGGLASPPLYSGADVAAGSRSAPVSPFMNHATPGSDLFRKRGRYSSSALCRRTRRTPQRPVRGPGSLAGGRRRLVVATRLHLGNASTPPDQATLDRNALCILRLAQSVGAVRAVVAVDPAPKIRGFDLPDAVRAAAERASAALSGEGGPTPMITDAPSRSFKKRRSLDGSSPADGSDDEEVAVVKELDVLCVTPWGKFVPALNALVSFSAAAQGTHLLFLSAETDATPEAIEALCRHVDDASVEEGELPPQSPATAMRLDLEQGALVAGAALPGHDYRGKGGKGISGPVEGVEVELDGRTTPWNTTAVWNVHKLALSGFPLVADGLHPNDDGSDGASGVEEVSAIATLQNLLPEGSAVAKLVAVPGVSWEQEWENDAERREWHERKMASKFTRAARHLDLMGLGGTVIHC